MAYIGKSPIIGNFVKLDAISVVNGQAAYTMQNGGANFTDYETVNQFLVSLNGTIQAPTDSFTVSGSTLTFASNLSTGDVIDFIIVFGNSLSAGTPTDGTVTTAKLADSSVTSAKLSGVTQGITMADQWRLTSGGVSSNGDITTNLERCNTNIQGTLGTGMTESSGVFTFPSTGFYQVLVTATFSGASENAMQILIKGTANNSSYDTLALIYDGQRNSTSTTGGNSGSTIVDIIDTSTHKIKFAAGSLSSGSTINGHDSENQTTFSFIRLGDT